MGAPNAEEEPGLAADGSDGGKPAARDLVGGLAVVDAADGLLDRDVGGVDGACGDEELGRARVGPGVRVETGSAGEETRGREALGVGRTRTVSLVSSMWRLAFSELSLSPAFPA